MKQFLFKILLFSAPVFIVGSILFLLADGYSDPFYIRFTTRQQSSLILGTSRAAQGVQPQVLNAVLGRHDLFNYSFTRGNSPYGPIYLNSIKKKLNPHAKNGIFIITVDAWSLASDVKNPNDSKVFEEVTSVLAATKYVNTNPNISYLVSAYDQQYIKLLWKNKYVLGNKNMFLHDDGWLELTVDMDPEIIREGTKSKALDYKTNVLPFYKYSALRYQYLIETVQYLKQFGQVYLVRLPIDPQMMAIDNALVPDLDMLTQQISSRCHVPYLNLTPQNEQWQYIDGNHLYKDSGKEVSREIAEWILKQQPQS